MSCGCSQGSSHGGRLRGGHTGPSLWAAVLSTLFSGSEFGTGEGKRKVTDWVGVCAPVSFAC